MALPYLITGLPRSRTAWFAAVCSTVDGSICYHEPSADYRTWQAAASLWDSARQKWCGISDSGFSFKIREIIDQWHPQVLIIERPAGEVLTSLEGIGIRRSNICDLMHERLDAVSAADGAMRVNFADLTNNHVVAGCLEHLMPGARICLPQIEIMQRLNIQADMDRVWKAVQARGGDLSGYIDNDMASRLVAV